MGTGVGRVDQRIIKKKKTAATYQAESKERKKVEEKERSRERKESREKRRAEGRGGQDDQKVAGVQKKKQES